MPVSIVPSFPRRNKQLDNRSNIMHLPRGCSPFRERVTVDERGVAFVKKLR